MKLNKLFTILMAAAVILGFAGCKNDLTLAEKLVGTGGGDKPSVTYNIDWDTKELVADKTLFSFAYKVNKIVFGYNKDYASVIADTSTYTKYHVGEEETDLIYAYYKAPSDDVTNDGELYVLSDGIIAIKENDKINCEGDMCGPFIDCTSAETIILKNIDTSSLTSFTAFFAHDRKLKTLDISGLDTTNAVTMNMMFDGDESLEAIDLSKFNTSKVTTMEYMFSWCSKLTSLDLSVFDTSKVKNMGSMFTECNGLTELDLSNFSFENVENTETMFCTWHTNKLKKIYVSEGTDFSTNTSITNSDMMFENCTSLIGGKGTVFDSSKTDKTYARIDGGSAAPGYFTKKGDSSGDSGESAVLYKYVITPYPLYFGYDKTTGKVTDCWIKTEELFGANRKYCVPPIEKKTDIQNIIGAGKDWKSVQSSDTTNYETVTGIINSSTVYDVDFCDLLLYFNMAFGDFTITKDKAEILSFLKKNVDLELPDEIKNNDLLFLKIDIDGVIVWDLTINKTYVLQRTDDDTALLVKGAESDLITGQKSEFPDNSTVAEVSNTTGYCIYYETESNPPYVLEEVTGVLNKLYKAANGKYFMYLPIGGY